jgi:hypothetical protein
MTCDVIIFYLLLLQINEEFYNKVLRLKKEKHFEVKKLYYPTTLSSIHTIYIIFRNL